MTYTVIHLYLYLFFYSEVIMLYLPAESGQALLEYALILVLIAVAVVGIVSVFGTTVFEVFSDVGSQLDQARADAN